MEPISKSSHYSSPSNNKFSSIFYLLLIIMIPYCHSESDQTALVYHHCTTNNNTSIMSQLAFSSLFKSLISQSTNSTFHRQTAAQNGVQISAEYQCRGDMSFSACQSCVTHLGILSNRLCAGAGTARVQLRGCYVRYEEANGGVGEEAKNDGELAVVVHKGCGEWGSGGFDDDGRRRARDAALWAVEEGIVRSGSGFCEARNEGIRAVAQCEGELLGCDCAECVSRAVEMVREDCRGRLAGDVYLNGCYVSYTTYLPLGDKKNGSSGKLVAVVLGGAATLGLGFILLMFFKSCGKKDDY